MYLKIKSYINFVLWNPLESINFIWLYVGHVVVIDLKAYKMKANNSVHPNI